MNKTIKIGIAVGGTGIFVNILERVIWPSISALPIDSPAKIPLLVILGAMVILSPISILIGIVVSLVGLGKPRS